MKVYIIIGSIEIFFGDQENRWIDSIWYNKIEAEERVKKLEEAYNSHDEKILKEVDYTSWEYNRYSRNPSTIEYIEFEIEEEIIQGTPNE